MPPDSEWFWIESPQGEYQSIERGRVGWVKIKLKDSEKPKRSFSGATQTGQINNPYRFNQLIFTTQVVRSCWWLFISRTEVSDDLSGSVDLVCPSVSLIVCPLDLYVRLGRWLSGTNGTTSSLYPRETWINTYLRKFRVKNFDSNSVDWFVRRLQSIMSSSNKLSVGKYFDSEATPIANHIWEWMLFMLEFCTRASQWCAYGPGSSRPRFTG